MKRTREVEELRLAYLDLWKNRLTYHASFVVYWKGNRVFFLTNKMWMSNKPLDKGRPAYLGRFWFPLKHPGTRLLWLGKHVYHVHNWQQLLNLQ